MIKTQVGVSLCNSYFILLLWDLKYLLACLCEEGVEQFKKWIKNHILSGKVDVFGEIYVNQYEYVSYKTDFYLLIF